MTQTIYQSTISKIKTLLETVPQIKEVFAHPLGKGIRAKKYPAVIFVPDSIDIDFSDTASNHHTMRFKLWIIVPTNNVEDTDVFEVILPGVVDAVVDAIGTGWDFGTIDGHRTWVRMESGNWGLSQEDKGLEAWAELNLTVRLDVDIN